MLVNEFALQIQQLSLFSRSHVLLLLLPSDTILCVCACVHMCAHERALTIADPTAIHQYFKLKTLRDQPRCQPQTQMPFLEKYLKAWQLYSRLEFPLCGHSCCWLLFAREEVEKNGQKREQHPGCWQATSAAHIGLL